MDDLLFAALEEVALQGSSGCPVDTLWGLVSARLPIGSVTQLHPQLAALVWSRLVARTFDVTCLYRKKEETNGADAGGPRGSRSVAGGAGDAVLPPGSPMLGSWEAAAAAGVTLLASEDVRHAAMGLYDFAESRFALSPLQLDCLERITVARNAGCIQSDVARAMGVAPRNFFYIVKCLEERALVIKTPVMLRSTVQGQPHSTSTNLMHLKRFAPPIRLGLNQVFKMVDAGSTLDTNLAAYRVHDDNHKLQEICDTIAGTAERVVSEAELKQVLGFRLVPGHRLWRKLKGKLQAGGFIRPLLAKVQGKATVCVQLIKPFTAEAAAAAAAAGGGEDGEEDEEGEEPGGMRMVVEVPLERQMVEVIARGGPAGVINNQVFEQLRVSSKKNAMILAEVIRKYNIDVQVVNFGKMMCNRLTAPPDVQAQVLRAMAPLALPAPPPGGYNSDGGSDGGDMVEADEGVAVGRLTLFSASPSAASPAAGGRGGRGSRGGRGGRGRVGVAVVAAVAAASPADALPAPAAIAAAPAATANPAGAAGAAAAAVAAPAQAQLALPPRPPPVVTTMQRALPEQTEAHMRTLVDAVNLRGFVPREQIRALVMVAEATAAGPAAAAAAAADAVVAAAAAAVPLGLVRPKGPDRKTVTRMLNVLEAAGRIKRAIVTLPLMRGRLGRLRQAEILLRPDVELDPPTLARIIDDVRTFEKAGRSGVKSVVARAEAAAGPSAIPTIESIARLLPGGTKLRRGNNGAPATMGVNGGVDVCVDHTGLYPTGGGDQHGAASHGTALFRNGFIAARMWRAQKLHWAVCQLVGLGGCPVPVKQGPQPPGQGAVWGPGPSQQQQGAEAGPAQQGQGQGAEQEGQTQAQLGQQQQEQEQQEQVHQLPSRTFSITELLMSMKLSTAIQVIGTSSANPTELLKLLTERDRTLGELGQAEVTRFFDTQFIERSSRQLNTLDALFQN
ncbi:hypothetical protein FOA52_011659 [Chlamydomonas sp. UWO 241]|nr:hypothetical protein FOA52_011659 [Chlamydomonas sp. UWO 241]